MGLMMAGSGTTTPWAAGPPSARRPLAICVEMKLLPVSMRGPKRSMMVWKRPEAPVSKIGSTMTTPSALNISKASQSKSSLWMHMFLVPLMSILTQVMQPVQCLMSRSIARMNSTSQPASLAARSTALQMVSLLPFLVPNETPTILVMATPFLSVHKRCAAHLPGRAAFSRKSVVPKPLVKRIENRVKPRRAVVLNDNGRCGWAGWGPADEMRKRDCPFFSRPVSFRGPPGWTWRRTWPGGRRRP